MGYTIPKDTQVIINVWAIGRNPESWENDSLYFKPERLLSSNIEYKGQNFEFLPLGAGRRKCPGQPLAQSLLHLVLASLLHFFDWKVQGSLDPKAIDMNEKVGILLRKLVPLQAVPMKRFL